MDMRTRIRIHRFGSKKERKNGRVGPLLTLASLARRSPVRSLKRSRISWLNSSSLEMWRNQDLTYSSTIRSYSLPYNRSTSKQATHGAFNVGGRQQLLGFESLANPAISATSA